MGIILNHYMDPIIQQPAFHGKYLSFFFVLPLGSILILCSVAFCIVCEEKGQHFWEGLKQLEDTVSRISPGEMVAEMSAMW